MKILTTLGRWSRAIFIFLEDRAGSLCLALLMIVLAIQVAGRAMGFGTGLVWTDEVARILFVWSVFLSVPLAAKHGALVSIKLSEKLWPTAWRPFMGKVAAIIWTLSALFIAVITLMNVYRYLEFPHFTPLLGLNSNYLHLVIPVAFLMVFVRGIINFRAGCGPKGE